MKSLLGVGTLVGVCALSNSAAAVYTLPAENRITWQTGSDIYNGGVLPNYTPAPCSPLHADGKSDDTANINACIAAAAADTAVVLPAGDYLVSGTIHLKSRVVLRGAGAQRTILHGTVTVDTPGGSIQPALVYKTNVVGYLLSGTPKKGDTQLTLKDATQASVGDWISVGSDNDPSFISAAGLDGTCEWCGDDSPFHLLQQIVQVTAKSGSDVTLSKPLYFTPYTTPQFKVYKFGVERAGIEDLALKEDGDIGASPIITFDKALFSWVKGVETVQTGSSSGSAHVRIAYSYGCEVRDSYFHDGLSGASGAGYGVHVYFVNSDHKIENNVMRHNRHSFVYEGGGTGSAVLYNYADDNYTDDPTYLGSLRANHGAHPYMDLWEGNMVSHVCADDYWGTSSHEVFFRNWLWGDESGVGVPQFPTTGFVAIDTWSLNTHYSYVGNVLGAKGMHATWSNAGLRPAPASFNPYVSASAPVVYGYSGDTASTTSINHGNYDYKTNGVAYWEGGADHQLANSMYYTARPSFWCAEIPWPAFGPDVQGVVNTIPAKLRYDGKPCTAVAAGGAASRSDASVGGSVSAGGASNEASGGSGACNGSTCGGTRPGNRPEPGCSCRSAEQEPRSSIAWSLVLLAAACASRLTRVRELKAL